MSESNIQYIGMKDFFVLAVELIAIDIKIHNHLFWLSDNKVYPPPLQLQLHKRIFNLIGFKKEDITEELEEWYFVKTELVLSIEVLNNEKALLELSAEILKELIKKRVESK